MCVVGEGGLPGRNEVLLQSPNGFGQFGVLGAVLSVPQGRGPVFDLSVVFGVVVYISSAPFILKMQSMRMNGER